VSRIRDRVLYQASDVLLLRAAVRSLNSAFMPWPELDDSQALRMWLVKAWEDPTLREAVQYASPSLTSRLDRIAAGSHVPARQARGTPGQLQSRHVRFARSRQLTARWRIALVSGGAVREPIARLAAELPGTGT
jgi:hypothetical protein